MKPTVGPEKIGERIRWIREFRGYSRNELARRSGVSKTTILRLERGDPTQERSLQSVAKALRYPKIFFEMLDEEWNRPYHVHRREDSAWHALGPIKKRPAEAPVDTSDPDERNRLGSLGFFDSFVEPINCLLRDANLGAALCEIYAASDEMAVHPGLEFAYVLHGSLIVTIGQDEVQLNGGEAMLFWADEPHDYRPVAPVKRNEQPPTVLMVVLEGIERLRFPQRNEPEP